MKAIVIVYNGDKLTEHDLKRISDIVGLYASEDSRVDITPISDSELAKTLAKSATIIVGDFQNKQPEWTPADAAVVFLGERYIDYIGNDDAFLTHLLKDLILTENKAYKDSEDQAFINAVQALSKKQVTISSDLAKKYKFTKSRINRIYEIYKAI